MSDSRLTLVLGASESTFRYSNRATERLLHYGEVVYLIGKKRGQIYGRTIFTEWPVDVAFHTITLYLNSAHQRPYYQSIISANPTRVIFNPGTENFELIELLKQNNIAYEFSCTLVLLATNQY